MANHLAKEGSRESRNERMCNGTNGLRGTNNQTRRNGDKFGGEGVRLGKVMLSYTYTSEHMCMVNPMDSRY